VWQYLEIQASISFLEAKRKGAPPVTAPDPKHTNPGASWAGQPYENTSGEARPLPNSPEHTPYWARRSFPLFSPEEAVAVIRALLDVIEKHALCGDDHLAVEMAQDLLARE